MGKALDLTGQRFGRLTVVRRAGSNRFKKALWECQCDCGGSIIAVSSHIKNGTTRSCGCLHSEAAAENGRKSRDAVIKHNGSHERLYRIWYAMRSRCNCRTHPRYKDWGGRGIRVCDEWAKDYGAFRDWAYSHGYDETAKRGVCTIERIDNDGNYCWRYFGCCKKFLLPSSKKRLADCPLRPLPEKHGRLIDGDELADGCDAPHWCRWLSEIEDMPTIVEAEG